MPARTLVTLVVLVTLAWDHPSAAAPAPPPNAADEILQFLGFTAEERTRLGRGEIVSHAVKELSDRELAITMAVLAPAPLERLVDYVRSGRAIEIDQDIVAHGSIDVEGAGSGAADRAEEAALRGIALDASEKGEIRNLFEGGPGSKLNLSQPEWERFARLREKFPAKHCDDDAACSEAVVSTLRGVLRDRVAAYREHGLAGIAPYARDGGPPADPAEELRRATNAATFLAQKFPAIFDAFLRYPDGDQSGIENHFLWLKQRVQDRPTFILSHRLLCEREGVAFAAERQFYVGHSYNSLQILYGLVPTGEKTLVVYVNRTSTDQVAGFMSGTRHSIGRKEMEKDVREFFEEILKGLAPRQDK